MVAILLYPVAWAGFMAVACAAEALFIGAYEEGDYLLEGAVAASALLLASVLAYITCRAIFVALAGRELLKDEESCTRCGYNLKGNVSGICPECGCAWELEGAPE